MCNLFLLTTKSMMRNPNPVRLVKRNNYINQGGGKGNQPLDMQKTVAQRRDESKNNYRQCLILRKKTRRGCKEMKKGKERKGGRREIKIRGFLRLNSPHKVPFQIKVKWIIATRNPTNRVQKGTTTSLDQWS